MRKKKFFNSAKELDDKIVQYFEVIEGKCPDERDLQKTDKSKNKCDPQPPTIAGLALYLGFNSRQAFEDYELNGKYASRLTRARLQIMADYEKKLHVTSSTGAIFALKSMGWNERTQPKPDDEVTKPVLKVQIIQGGPPLASAENEVDL